MSANKITIETSVGLYGCSIELIRKIESELDAVMVGNGFTRTTTSKSGDSLRFHYRQFGKCLEQKS